MPELPTPPLSPWPVQLHERAFGFAWYAEPAAFVMQATVEHGTVAFVERFNDLIDHVLHARRDEVRAAGGLLIFHDWRTLTGYDREARTRVVERMKVREPGYARRTIVVVSPRNRLLRMAVEAVNLFATVTLRSTIELGTSADSALSVANLTPPSPGAQFP